MREDMFKVIVERPRHGSRYADVEIGRTRFRDGHRDADEPRAHESLRSRHRWHKGLNENLNPLRRWLEKQVGRPWDKVFAELCAGIDRRSTVQQHIHQHVGDFVARNVVRIDGELVATEGWRAPRPLAEYWGVRLYVDPDIAPLRDGADAGHADFDVLRHVPVRIAGRQARKGALGGDRERYGRDDVYAWRRRQLSAKELLRYGVENENEH